MFLDASAIIAVLTREPGFEHLMERIEKAPERCSVSPIVRFETVMGLSRGIASGSGRRAASDLSEATKIFDQFVDRIDAEEIEVTAGVGRAAVSASAAYGKAVGHPAKLNMGDCFAYACAKALGVPLLYKGDDFALTDLA